MTIVSPAKVCRACGVEKPPSEFNRHAGRPDGRDSRCKPCSRNRNHPPMRHGPAPRDPLERFMEKVEKTPDGCWTWRGALSDKGYGFFKATPAEQVKAHRWSYEHFIGLVPDGLLVCHTCDNPPCVNPAHLFAGTQLENLADMKAKGRGSVGVRNGFAAPGQSLGTLNINAKLNPDIVRRIRALHADGMPMARIAKELGVTPQCIHAVVRRETWVHVE